MGGKVAALEDGRQRSASLLPQARFPEKRISRCLFKLLHFFDRTANTPPVRVPLEHERSAAVGSFPAKSCMFRHGRRRPWRSRACSVQYQLIMNDTCKRARSWVANGLCAAL